MNINFDMFLFLFTDNEVSLFGYLSNKLKSSRNFDYLTRITIVSKVGCGWSGHDLMRQLHRYI